VASQPNKTWTAGCIPEKFGVFFAKRIERGGRTAGCISLKFKGFFYKMAGAGPIWAIRPADRTADMPVVLLKLMVSSAKNKFCVLQIIV